MCGIAGVVSWSNLSRIEPATLDAMGRAIAHRGPDDAGVFINHLDDVSAEKPQVGFAFRRLAVIDLDRRSAQPMRTNDGRYSIVFNGEIYNFRQLRSQLESDFGFVFATDGDAEVLLAAYIAWGEAALPRLNGMFAFAIWDDAEKSLFLARDRMGQKPLYLLLEDDRIAFASEIAALRPLGLKPRKFDDWLPDYLAYGYCTHSPFERLTQAAPATFYRFTARQRSQGSYFDANLRPAQIDPILPAKVRDAVELAVARQLVADVPLGVLLSGGIDSSVVAACARRQMRIKTFSVRFNDSRYDESPFAERVARHLDTDHHVIDVDTTEFDLLSAARCFGEPFADSSAVPTLALCREVRKHVTVALGGDGGDELFGGYDRYSAMQIGPALSLLRPFASIGRRLSGGHPKSTLARVGRLISTAGLEPALRYESIMRLFDDSLLAELAPQFARPRLIAEKFRAMRSRSLDAVEAALAVDRVSYLPNDLLTKVDRCSMAFSLEVRSPFMDHELLELAACLDRQQLLAGGKKRMLREAFADDLPAEVFQRPKTGFAVPIADVFRGGSGERWRAFVLDSAAQVRSVLDSRVIERLFDEHAAGRRDHSQRLYSLVVLEDFLKSQST